MRNIRQLLLAVLIGVSPAAHAQWTTSRIEHDWRVSITGNDYGLTQEFFSTWSTVHGTRTTTIHFGQHMFRTRLPAFGVAALALTFVGAVAFPLVVMLPRKREYVLPEDALHRTWPSRSWYWRMRHGWSVVRRRRALVFFAVAVGLLFGSVLTHYHQVFSSRVVIAVELERTCDECY